MKCNFKDFYYLTENIYKRRDSRSTVERLRKYFNHPSALVSFRDEIPTSSVKDPELKIDDRMINPSINPLVGINPKSKYKTPNGIYGYPIAETKEMIENWEFPFAANRKYAVVYKPKDNVPVLYTSSFTKENLEEKKLLIAKIYFNNNLEAVDDIISELDSKYTITPARTLWSLTRELSKGWKYNTINFNGRTNSNKWTKILISIGVPIFIDDSGEGTIHEAEPIQGVIFGRQYLDILETFNNYNPMNFYRHSLETKIISAYNYDDWVIFCGNNIFDGKTFEEFSIAEVENKNETECKNDVLRFWKEKNKKLSLLHLLPEPWSTKFSLIRNWMLFTQVFVYQHELKYSFSDYTEERKYLKIEKDEINKNPSLYFSLLNSVITGPTYKIKKDLALFVMENLELEDPDMFKTCFEQMGRNMFFDEILGKRTKKAIESNGKNIAKILLEKVEKYIDNHPISDAEPDKSVLDKYASIASTRVRWSLWSLVFVVTRFPKDCLPEKIEKYFGRKHLEIFSGNLINSYRSY